MKPTTKATTKAITKTAAPKTVAGVPLPTRGTLRGATRVTTALDDAGMMPNPALQGASPDGRKVQHLELPEGTDMAAVAALITAGVAAFNTQTVSAKTRRVEVDDPEAGVPTAEETPMEKALTVLRDQLSGAEQRFGELVARLEPVLAYPQAEDPDCKTDDTPPCWATSPLHRQINDVMERVARLAQGIAEVRDRVTV